MYNPNSAQLEQAANALNQIAKKYTDSGSQLTQHVTTLDGATSQLLTGGSIQWKGVASEAFQGGWLQRRVRIQQAEQLLSTSAPHLSTFASAIEQQLPTIRSAEQALQGAANHHLAADDQKAITDEMLQAQNAIATALSTLNSALDSLAENIGPCPETQEEGGGNYPGYSGGKDVNANDAGGGGESGGESEKLVEDAAKNAGADEEQTINLLIAEEEGKVSAQDLADILGKNVHPEQVLQLLKEGGSLGDIQPLLDKGLEGKQITELIENGFDLKDSLTDVNNLLRQKGSIEPFKIEQVKSLIDQGADLTYMNVLHDKGVPADRILNPKNIEMYTDRSVSKEWEGTSNKKQIYSTIKRWATGDFRIYDKQGRLVLDKNGQPFRFSNEGDSFESWHGEMPPYATRPYKEYTVPDVNSANMRDKGRMRIVVDADGRVFYFAHHYNQKSTPGNPLRIQVPFEVIRQIFHR